MARYTERMKLKDFYLLPEDIKEQLKSEIRFEVFKNIYAGNGFCLSKKLAWNKIMVPEAVIAEATNEKNFIEIKKGIFKKKYAHKKASYGI